jgi:Tol biopolymer transport system component
MGEVYRARDTRLGRDVAIKVLADALARDPDHLARFEREARVLASLEHPNIAVIHGLEESDAMRYLVLELVEGDTVAGKLAAGPIPPAEAYRLGAQIAAALEAAHEKGVIHRDLKPGNVQVTPGGRVKVLDFGLAKSLEGRAGDLSAAATISAAAATTQDGTILGTPAYMSPEQARGRPVDKRTDLWSFGCVLYEMLTGCRAFRGETASDTLVAVLSREPDFSELPRGIPDPIRRLIARCLEKDPERRMRDAGDARLELESAITAEHAVRRPGGFRRWLLPMIAAALLAAVVVLLVRGRGGAPAGPRRAARLVQVTLAEGVEQFPAFSPDGERLAYTAESGGVRKILIRTLATGEERRATSGDHDDIQPAWSPDGKTLLFVRSREAGKRLEPGDVFGWYVGGDVWSLDLGSGRESRLVEGAFNPSFSPDGGRIAVDADWAGGHRIWIVTAAGSNPQQVTSDVSEAFAHLGPRWSPDGARIVFQTFERTRFDVRVVDVASKTIVKTTDDLFRDLNPVWAPSGRAILFTSDRGGGLNVWRVPVRPDGSPSEPPEQLTTGAGQDVELAVSPDGKRLAFAILKQNADLWKLPVSSQTGLAAGEPSEVLATTREDSRGAWSPDGRRIAFNSDRAGEMNLWVTSPEGVRQLTRGPGGDYQPNWSPEGRRIAFFSARAGNQDIWSVDVSSGALQQLTKSPSIDVNPFFSKTARASPTCRTAADGSRSG